MTTFENKKTANPQVNNTNAALKPTKNTTVTFPQFYSSTLSNNSTAINKTCYVQNLTRQTFFPNKPSSFSLSAKSLVFIPQFFATFFSHLL